MNNNVLICTAILTSIHKELGKSNIDLLLPFELYIIYSSGEIDDENLIKKMIKDFSFINYPHEIHRIVINELKDKKMIIKKDGKYQVSKEEQIKTQIKKFEEKLNISKSETDKILSNIQKYLKSTYNIKLSPEECNNQFSKYLQKNGYVLYENEGANINKANKRNKKNYEWYIGDFIEHCIKNDREMKQIILNITEGSLLANALYVNIGNDNNENLSELSCYLDTTFLLRILGAKLPFDNESANELLLMLKNQKARIKCFKHNFREVEVIIEDFINNRKGKNGRTLEGFLIKGYDNTFLMTLLSNLEETLLNKGITIEETPEFDKSKYSKYIINETKLKKEIKEGYDDKTTSPLSIDNDIKTISAIVRIRDNKKIKKLEKSRAIFITTNDRLRLITNNHLKLDTNFYISPVMSNTDITAIVWLKCLSERDDLLETILIENARAAMEMPQGIRRKLQESVERIKNDDINKTSVYALIYNDNIAKEIMLESGGDAAKVSSDALIRKYDESILNERITNNKNLELQKRLEKEREDKQEIINRIKEDYDFKKERARKIIITVEKITAIAFGLLICVISFIQSNNIILKIISFIFLGYSSISTMTDISVFKLYRFVGRSINRKLFPKVDYFYNNKKEKILKKYNIK